MKKHKICFVVPGAYYLFNPEEQSDVENIGGAQYQAYLISKELAKKEFDVHFTVFYSANPNPEIIGGVSIIKVAKFKEHIVLKAYKLLKELKKVDASLYIFRSADFGVAIVLLYLRFFLRKKVFYMLASETEISLGSSISNLGIFTSLLMQLAYKKANYISAQTHQQGLLFKEHRKRSPDYLLKNIVPEKLDLNYEPIIEKKYILWVGRLSKLKNAELFLELAKRNPEESFIMIGPEARKEKKYGIRIKTAALKQQNIQYLGYVANNEISNYYKQSKIYILSSFQEGFSNTMAEAMQHRCAILSFMVNPDNIISEQKAGYFSNGSKDAFFDQFTKMKNEQTLLAEFGQNGHQYINHNHRKELIAYDYAAYIHSILS